MMPHEDIHFQLVDLPALSPEHPVSWLAGTLQTADAVLLVVDLSEPSCLEQMQAVRAALRAKRITLTERWDPVGTSLSGTANESDEDLPTITIRRLLFRLDAASNDVIERPLWMKLATVSWPGTARWPTTSFGRRRP